MIYDEYIIQTHSCSEDQTAIDKGFPELIRCKDCKHCRTYYHGENMPFTYACDLMYLTNNLSSNDYCSRGVKRGIQ